MIFEQTHFIKIGPSWGKVILISAVCIVGAILLHQLYELTKMDKKSKFTYKPKAEEKKDDTAKS